MARSISPDKRREYDPLKRFFAHWATHPTSYRVFALDHPHNPLNVLAGLERQLGVSRALVGLKLAVNDILEDCEDFSPQKISRADASLTGAGAPTLTQPWQERSRQYKAMRPSCAVASCADWIIARPKCHIPFGQMAWNVACPSLSVMPFNLCPNCSLPLDGKWPAHED